MLIRFLAVLLLCLSSLVNAAPAQKEYAKASVMVPLTVEFTDEALAPVQAKLDELVKNGDKTLLIQIDSGGGNMDTGWKFVSHVKNLKKQGVHVQCLVDWQAASMAADFLEAACDERWAVPQAFILFHKSSSMSQGNALELKETVKMLETLDKGIVAVVARRLGLTPDQMDEKIRYGTWTLSAQDALDAHAIDAIKDNEELPPVADLTVPAPNPLSLLKKLLGG